MTTKDLRNNIDKVLGNSIRCLLPSYWWKRLFHQVADTIDEVADTIDDINDITIVDSESKLSKLDVPSGSVASVYNERKFKFSECYSITPEDSNLSDDEIFAKCTRIKAIDVNYDSLSEIDGTKLDAGFFFASYENNQLEQTGVLSVNDIGVPLFVVLSTNGNMDIAFPLTNNAGQTRCNEYLSQHDIRYIMFQGSTEERLILESIFSVVEADIDVYVKGTSWEKLAKEGDSGESNIVINKGVKDITYAELVNLVVTRKLVTGTNYRITDYELKINSDWMRVVERNRWYKIIVTATSNSTLDENAAIEYEYENLFIHGAVHLYKIKYSVFNDDAKYPIANPKYIVVKYGEQTKKLYYMYTQGGSFGEYKYLWCPNPYLEASLWNCFSTTENPSVGDVVYNDIDQEYIEITEVVNGEGKGVIYYMEDERGNAAPFDFKNVQFKVYSASDYISFAEPVKYSSTEWLFAFDFLQLKNGRIKLDSGGTVTMQQDYSSIDTTYIGALDLPGELTNGMRIVIHPCRNNKLYGYNILEPALKKLEGGGMEFSLSNNVVYGNKNTAFVYNNCIINKGCDNISLNFSSSVNEKSNIEILDGVSGEDDSVLVIDSPTSASADTKTYIGRDSSGNIKTFNVADENIGGGDDILRVIIPDVNILEFACQALGRRPIINMTEMSEVLRFLDELFSLAHNQEATIWADNYTPVLEKMFAHNALIYAKIKEKTVNKESVQVMWDGSESYSTTLSIIDSISGGAYNDISWENVTLSGYANAATSGTEEFVEIIPLAQEANAIGVPCTFIPNVNLSLSASGEFVLEDVIDTVLYTFDDAGFQVSENIKTLEKGSIHNVTLYERPGYKFPYPIIDSSYEEGFGFKGKYIKDNNICQITIPADTGIPKETILNKIDKEDVLRVMLPDIVSNEFLFLGGDFSIANINDALLMLESDMPELKEVSELIFNNMISNNISIYEKIVNNAIDNNGVTMLVDFSKTYPILDSLLGEFGISSESIIHTVKVIKNGEDIQVKFYNTTSENDDFGKIVYELKSTGEVIYSKYDLVLPHNGTNLSDELKKANAEALIYIEDARLPKSMVNLYLIDVNNTLHNISTIIATSTSYDSNLNPTYIIDFINPVSYSIDKASIHNDGAVEIATSASLTAIL